MSYTHYLRETAKDTQMQKVYDAEQAVFHNATASGFQSFEEVNAFVAKVFASAWFKRHFPQAYRPPRLHEHNGGRTAFARGYSIHLPKNDFGKKKWVVLHELAHCLTPSRSQEAGHILQSHGREFCAIYLKLIGHGIGPKTQKALRDSFRQHKVKYLPKKRLSPEQLNALKERGRRLAEQHGLPEKKSEIIAK
jgi:putative metallohydrolase (TIGR04338 family)